MQHGFFLSVVAHLLSHTAKDEGVPVTDTHSTNRFAVFHGRGVSLTKGVWRDDDSAKVFAVLLLPDLRGCRC